MRALRVIHCAFIVGTLILAALACGAPVYGDNLLRVATVTADASATDVKVGVFLTNDDSVSGFSFALDHEPLELEATALDLVGGVLLSADTDLIIIDIDNKEGLMSVAAALLDGEDILSIPVSEDLRIANGVYDIVEVPACSLAEITLSPFGDPPLPIELVDEFGTVLDEPNLEHGGIEVGPAEVSFTYENLIWVVGGDDNLARINPGDGADPTEETSTNLSGTPEPVAVAVDTNALTWVALFADDQVARFAPDGAQEGSDIDVGSEPVALAADPDGNVWVSHEEGGTLWKIAGSGCILLGVDGLLGESIDLGGSGVSALAVDAQGNVWAPTSTPELLKFSNSGATLFELALDFPVEDMAVDREDHVWLATDDRIERRASDGSVEFEYGFGIFESLPLHVVVAGSDADEVWLSLTSGDIYRFVDEEPELFFGASAPSALGVDGYGNVLVFDESAEALYSLDPSDSAPVSTPDSLELTFAPVFQGDPTGFVAANILQPDTDFDSDDGQNRNEIIAGFNPFTGGEGPEAPAVSDLTCEVEGNLVEISWSVSIESYDEFDVFVDGELEQTISSELNSITFESVDPGPHVYEVVGRVGEADSIAVSCNVVVGSGAELPEVENQVESDGEKVTIFDLTCVPTEDVSLLGGLPNQVTTWVSSPNGRIYGLNQQGQPIVEFQGPFARLAGVAFVDFGDNGNGSLLCANGDTQSPGSIAEITLTGDLMRSSDDAQYAATNDVDDIEGGIAGLTFTGSQPDGVISAAAPTTCEVWGFRYSNFDRLNEFSTEHPGATEQLQYQGQNGISSVHSSFARFQGDDLPDTIELALTVRNEDGSYEIRTYELTESELQQVGTVIPLFALEDQENVFGGFAVCEDSPFDSGQPGVPTAVAVAGETTGKIYGIGVSPTPLFLRGDVDGNGEVMAVVDALALLEWGFTAGQDPPCLDAANANGDSKLEPLTDSIFLIEWGFFSGPEPPAPGPNSCGEDTEENDISCNTSAESVCP